MGRLIIVAGASGAGKSFFLQCWEKHDAYAQVIKKYVSEDRVPRKREVLTGESDLIFSKKYDPTTKEGRKWYDEHYPGIAVSENLQFAERSFGLPYEINNPFMYQYGDTYYEIDRVSLEDALRKGLNPIVIVRDFDVIAYLLKQYESPFLIYVQSILSGIDLYDALKKFQESEIDISERMRRTFSDLEEFSDHMKQLPYFRIVLNDFVDKKGSIIVRQIKDIYGKHIANFMKRKKSIFLIQSYSDGKALVRNAIVTAFANVFAELPELVVEIGRASCRERV